MFDFKVLPYECVKLKGSVEYCKYEAIYMFYTLTY